MNANGRHGVLSRINRMNQGLSIILPVYNEANSIGAVIDSIMKSVPPLVADFEIITVDDGSTDATSGMLRKISGDNGRVAVVTHERNLGYGRTLVSGIKAARYPLLLFMDADGQFDIRDVCLLLDRIKDCDIVMGYRADRKDNAYRCMLSRLYSLCVLMLFGMRIRDVNCGFKLVNKEVCVPESMDCRNGVFYTELLLRTRQQGRKIAQIPVTHLPRREGKSTGGSIKVILNSIIDLMRLRLAWRRRGESA